MPTPEFVLSLREKIGHDLLWLMGVSGYVEDEQGRVLLGRRSDTGEWAMVYGINEPGEEPADTVAREVKEETGVEFTEDEAAFIALHFVNAVGQIVQKGPHLCEWRQHHVHGSPVHLQARSEWQHGAVRRR